MGWNMMFRFQPKEEQIYLIHLDADGQGLWAEPWLSSEESTPAPPKSRKNKKVWRVKKTSPSSTSSLGTD
jgi:hypothetical protein